MKKKLFVGILVLTMLVACLSLSALADGELGTSSNPCTSAEDVAQVLGVGNAVAEGDTVKVSQSFNLGRDIYIQANGITLNLGDNTITLTGDSTIFFYDDATITGGDSGEITKTDAKWYAVSITRGANVSITGGTISNSGTSSKATQAVLVSDGSLNMSGGKLEAGNYCTALFVQSNGTAIISDDAEISGTSSRIEDPAVTVMSGSSLKMEGGKIDAQVACMQVQNEGSTVTVTGGEITNATGNAEGTAAVFVVTKGNFAMTDGKITAKGIAVSVGSAKVSEDDDTKTDSAGTTATIGGTAEISRDGDPSVGLLEVKDYCILNIEDQAKIKDTVMVFANGTLNVKGGTIESDGYAIGTNGSEEGSDNSSKGAKINITGGEVKSTGASACGIYLPAGELNVSEKAMISGTAGIVVRGGELTVTGGTIESTGGKDAKVEVGDSGKSVPAAGITVDNAGYPEQAEGQKHVTVTEGATITATEDGGKIFAAAKDGTEATPDETEKVKPEENPFDIQGGTFTVNNESATTVAQYLPYGYDYTDKEIVPQEGVEFVVERAGIGYTTLNEAILAAETGETITLIKDVTLPGTVPDGADRITVTKTVTIDLNGKTLSKAEGLADNVAGMKIGANGNLTIVDNVGDGKVTGNGTVIATFDETASLTLDGCAIVQTGSKEDDNNAAIDSVGGTITVKDGTTITADETGLSINGNDGKLVVEGGTIDAKVYGIATNGSNSSKSAEVTITGGTITGDYAGMYLPSQGGKTTVTGDVTITGTDGAGVVVRGGTITVEADEEGNAPTITAGGTEAKSYGSDKEKVELPAGALVVDKNDGYGSSDTKATLSAGTFEAAKGQPSVTYVEKGEEPTEDPTTGVEIEIENLTDITLKSGDTGDYKAAKYLGDASMTIAENGNPDVRTKDSADAFFTIPNNYGKCVNYYPDFESAVAALKESSGKPANTIYVNRSVELDKEITVDSEITIAVSPEAAETDPVISATGRVIEVDNGVKLTLDGVTIVSTDGTPDVADNVAAIKVSGELTVKAGTSITADATAIFVAGSTGKLTMTGGDVKSNTEIAIGTNGSLTTGATIDISGGTVTGADTASGVYVPVGTLTVSGDAAISGGAGIVARGAATVTVKADDDGIAPTVTATGDGTVTVGDSTKEIPAKAVVKDSTTGTTKVEAGKFVADGKADYSVINYVTDTNGVDVDGNVVTAEAVKDELFIVDFGYIANKADLGENANTWTSPNGIVYNVGTSGGKWGDATFYFAFNRKITNADLAKGTENKITVTFKCGNITVSDTIGAEGIRYATSFKNKDQLADDLAQYGDAITGGDYTIGCGDTTATFDVPESIESVQVTLPAVDTAEAPVIYPAPTVNQGEGEHHGKDENVPDYAVGYTAVNDTSKEYSVVIDATGVVEHMNADGVYGYWVGLAIKDSGSHVGYWARIDGGKWQPSKLDAVDVDASGEKEEKYACIYFKDIKEYTVELVWASTDPTADDAQEPEDDAEGKLTFHVSTMKVTQSTETERPTRPAGGGASATTSKVTTPENGSVELSSTTARGGQTVTVTATPDEGYDIGDVIVKDRNGNPVEVTKNDDGTYSYTVPAGKTPVTVEVVFDECLCDDFADLDLDEWYHEAVDYAIKNELMLGQGDGFAPSAPVRRAEIAVILGRMEGKGFETGGEHWYDESLAWAMEEGITDGSDPLRDCKREEVVTMLWRYMDKPESDADLSAYVDADQVDDWALDAMKWAVETGIIQGRDNNDLQPTDTLTRAEFATILQRIGATVAE